MNRNINPFNKIKGEWKTIINSDIDRTGVATKRDGYVKFLNNNNEEILSLIKCEIGDARRLIKITKAGKLYSAEPGVSVDWGTPIETGLSTSKKWGSTVMSDINGIKYLILGNGVDIFKTTDGVAFTTVPGAPKAQYWETYQQRVYCAGVDADKDVFHWSSIGDLTDWSVVDPSDSGSANVDKFYKGNIKAIIECNNKLVIYKDKLMKRWDEENLRNVLTNWGTEAPWSVIKIDGMPLSFDREAIRLYDGNQPQNISSPIKDIIDRVDMTNADNIFAVGYKDKYYLFVGDIEDDDMTIKNCVIVYDTGKSMFWLYSLAHDMTTGTKLRRITDNKEVVYFAGKDGQVYEMFNGNQDDGQDIEMILESHIIYPMGSNIDIKPKSVGIISKYPGQMNIMLSADYKEYIQMGEVSYSVERFETSEFSKDSHGISIKITHSTKGKPMLYGYTIGYEPSTNRRERS